MSGDAAIGISPLVRAALRVADLARSARFYHALGYSEVYFQGALEASVVPALLGVARDARTRCLILKTPGQPNFGMVGLFEIAESAPRRVVHDGRGFQVGEAALVFYVADIESSLTAALLHGGVRVSGPLTLTMPHRGQLEALLRDPDGVLINLVERAPAEAYDTASVAGH